MKLTSIKLLPPFCVIAVALFLFVPPGSAQTWRAVQDTNGWTWARVTFINQWTNQSDWVVWNCRAAVNSTADSAVTDMYNNWSGAVAAGATNQVWIYGLLGNDVNIVNTDGGPASNYPYPGDQTLAVGGDSELVITIASDGSVSTAVQPGATYRVPSVFGNWSPQQ